MKKVLKSTAVVLVLAMTVTCFALMAASCGGDKEENSTGYTVKLVYADGSAVDGSSGTKGGITVQFCEVDAAHEELSCELPITVSADGTATATNLKDLDEGHSYHVKLNNLPSGATFEDKYYMDKPGTLTITINK